MTDAAAGDAIHALLTVAGWSGGAIRSLPWHAMSDWLRDRGEEDLADRCVDGETCRCVHRPPSRNWFCLTRCDGGVYRPVVAEVKNPDSGDSGSY